MSVIERLAEKVARQEEKVSRETEKLEHYRDQLQTAMYSTFIKRQQSSQLSFHEALEQAFGKETTLHPNYRMSKTWNFDQPLDDVKPTSSHEERAKIAALFHKQDEKPIEEVDYVAAFEQQQKESESKDVQTPESKVKQSQPKKVNITSDYKQHLADTIAQNNKDISACQKQIEELHQLIDEKKIQNKKLQAISVAIDDL